MYRTSGKPIEMKNDFAAGFGALEDAEKAKKKAAKKAAKKAEREALAAEEAKNAPPVEEAPEASEPKASKKIDWGDCDSDEDLMGL